MKFDLTSFLRQREDILISSAKDKLQLDGKQVLERLFRIANYLQRRGIKRGDFCVFQDLLPLESFLLILACMGRGVIAVPLNPRFRDDHLKPYLEQIPPVKWVNSAEWQQDSTDAITLDIDEHQAGLIIFTSGSTGPAKGVVHSWSSLAASAQSSLEFYGMQAGWSWLLSLGLFHVGGLMIGLRSLLGRGRLLIPDPELSLAQSIRDLRPDWLSLVPTQLSDLMHEPEMMALLQNCHGIVLGGAAAHPEVLQKSYEHQLPLSLSYGSSETAAQIAATLPGHKPQRLDLAIAGKPLPGREVQLEAVSQRIQCRGPGMFQGYWMAGKFYPHGENAWFLSSDRGQWTEDGLAILGRVDDVFTCGGENLSRSEIQTLVAAALHPIPCLVVKQTDVRLGWLPVLYIESRLAPDPLEIVRRLQQALPAVKRPRKIYWSESARFIFANEKPSLARLEAFLSRAVDSADVSLLWSHS